MDKQEFTKLAEAATQHVFENAYVPAFIKRCNEYGVTFNSDEDVALALQNVATIKAAEGAKAPSTASNIHKQASAALAGITGTNKTAADKDLATIQDIPVSDETLQAASFLAALE